MIGSTNITFLLKKNGTKVSEANYLKIEMSLINIQHTCDFQGY